MSTLSLPNSPASASRSFGSADSPDRGASSASLADEPSLLGELFPDTRLESVTTKRDWQLGHFTERPKYLSSTLRTLLQLVHVTRIISSRDLVSSHAWMLTSFGPPGSLAGQSRFFNLSTSRAGGHVLISRFE